mmetsp:Transcript_77558/g.171332  ORF Transcript_77558/g.171332 Transcript_77558/m.171332 type:complete len:322 (-) Transcript_77558:749-1714(-)
MNLGDHGEQLLTDHLLLHRRWSVCQSSRAQLSTSWRASRTRHHSSGSHGSHHHGRIHAHWHGHGWHTTLSGHHLSTFTHHSHHGSLRHRSLAHHLRHHSHHWRPHHAHHRLLRHHSHHASHIWVVAAFAALVALAPHHALATSGRHRVALAEPLLPRFTLLSKAHIQRLTFDDLQVHLSHCLGRLIGRCEAYEAKALALAVAVQWYGRRRDRAELFKELLQGWFVNAVIQILHVQVHTTLAGVHRCKLGAELCLALTLRLSARAVDLVFRMPIWAETLLPSIVHAVWLHVNSFHCCLRRLTALEGHESKRSTFVVLTERMG